MTVESSLRVGRLLSPFRIKHLRFPVWLARERSYLYYAERQSRHAALVAARELLDDLFGARARQDGKQVWCEQTTNNQDCANFLLELLPSGLYIDTVRDPLDVALAHQAQSWAPPDFAMTCTMLRARQEHWWALRATLPADSYLEVRFEELTVHPERELERVCHAIGIRYDPRLLNARADPRRLQQESQRRKSADTLTYRRILGPIAEQLGYPVSPRARTSDSAARRGI